jgi:hypothetical protein
MKLNGGVSMNKFRSSDKIKPGIFERLEEGLAKFSPWSAAK